MKYKKKELGFFEMIKFRGNKRRRRIELKFRYHIYKDIKKGIMLA